MNKNRTPMMSWKVIGVFAILLGGCGEDETPHNGRGRALLESWEIDLGEIQSGREVPQTILEVNGGGVALFDGDGDGDLEVFVVSPGDYPLEGSGTGGSNRLYRNDGGAFVDVTAGSGVDLTGYCNGVAVADVNGDGLRDLYVTRFGENALLLNQGNLVFHEAPQANGAAGLAGEWSTSALFLDLEGDGDMDLYVANYLDFDARHPPLHEPGGLSCVWKGMEVLCGPEGLPPQENRVFVNTDGRFEEKSESLGFAGSAAFSLGVMDGDFNQDGIVDVYVTNDSMPNALYISDGQGAWREQGVVAGVALSGRGREQAGMGIAAGDVDGDGREDLLVTNFSMESNALYRQVEPAMFTDTIGPSGMSGVSRRRLGWGASLMDVDFDGDLDVVTANGHVYPQAASPGTDTSYAQPDGLWLNQGEARFATEPWSGTVPAVSRSLAWGDLNGDRIPDLVVTQRQGAVKAWRGVGDAEDVLMVDIVGPRGNLDAVGAILKFEDGQGVQTRRVRGTSGYQSYGDTRSVMAYRGPGTLTVIFPSGDVMTRSVEGPGGITIRWDA